VVISYYSSASDCQAQRSKNGDIACDSEGYFEPLRCSRLSGSSMLDCHCVHPVTGLFLSKSRRWISSKNDLLDCHSHSKKSCLHDLSIVMVLCNAATFVCTLQRGEHQILLRHGEAAPSCNQTTCMKCVCNFGSLSCSLVQGAVPMYALEASGGDCSKDGVTIRHGNQVMVSS
jgi:hypothetical protein